MNITIRHEKIDDYRTVEELTREAFWGAMNHATCDGEHLLVHKLRTLPSFIPELDFVAEIDGEIAGHIIYSKAKIVTENSREIQILNFGPISVLPKYKRKGIGSALMRHSISEAKRLGYRAIVFYGHPDYYPRFGFSRGSAFGIVSENGESFDALMAMPLYDGALDEVCGRYIEDSVYNVNAEEAAEFDKSFPPKEPVVLITVESIADRLTSPMTAVLKAHKMKNVAQLQTVSGAEILQWEGVSEQDLTKLNLILAELNQPVKQLYDALNKSSEMINYEQISKA